MKKRGLAAALAMLTMATTGTAFAATNYWIPVYYNNPWSLYSEGIF